MTPKRSRDMSGAGIMDVDEHPAPKKVVRFNDCVTATIIPRVITSESVSYENYDAVDSIPDEILPASIYPMRKILKPSLRKRAQGGSPLRSSISSSSLALGTTSNPGKQDDREYSMDATEKNSAHPFCDKTIEMKVASSGAKITALTLQAGLSHNDSISTSSKKMTDLTQMLVDTSIS